MKLWVPPEMHPCGIISSDPGDEDEDEYEDEDEDEDDGHDELNEGNDPFDAYLTSMDAGLQSQNMENTARFVESIPCDQLHFINLLFDEVPASAWHQPYLPRHSSRRQFCRLYGDLRRRAARQTRMLSLH